MGNERTENLLANALDWIWYHTAAIDLSEYVNALYHIGFTEEEIRQKLIEEGIGEEDMPEI